MRNPLTKGLIPLLAWCACSLSVWADPEPRPTPTQLPGAAVIDTTALLSLMDREKTMLIDVRSSYNYGKRHIPGASSIEYHLNYHTTPLTPASSGKFEVSRLPDDRDAPIIFYSHGVTGWKSYLAAKEALGYGYMRVYWYRGGIEAWLDSGKTLATLRPVTEQE